MNLSENKNIVVIGNGIAGFMAASYLYENGVTPIVISKGYGATSMFSGGYDFGSFNNLNSCNRLYKIIDNIEILMKKNQYHPYNKIDNLLNILSKSFKFFKTITKLPLTDLNLDNHPYKILTQYGNFTTFDILDINLSKLDIDFLKKYNKDYGVAFLEYFNKFDSKTILSALNNYKKDYDLKSNFRSIHLHFLKRNSDASFKNYDLAKLFEKEKAFYKFLDSLEKIVTKTKISHLIMPPVMGIYNNIKWVELIKKSVGVDLIETISTLPSIYGIRLQNIFENYYKENKIPFILTNIKNFTSENGEIKFLITTDKKIKKIKTKAIILATGKFIGGGITVNNGTYKESIFNLPIYYKNRILNNERDNFFNINYFANHPIFSLGLSVDNKLKPQNRFNESVYNNLFTAGNIIEGYNNLNREGGLGVAIATGYYAAKMLLREFQND